MSRHTITLFSGKGGAGKTTTAKNLGASFAIKTGWGKQVGIKDTDGGVNGVGSMLYLEKEFPMSIYRAEGDKISDSNKLLIIDTRAALLDSEAEKDQKLSLGLLKASSAIVLCSSGNADTFDSVEQQLAQIEVLERMHNIKAMHKVSLVVTHCHDFENDIVSLWNTIRPRQALVKPDHKAGRDTDHNPLHSYAMPFNSKIPSQVFKGNLPVIEDAQSVYSKQISRFALELATKLGIHEYIFPKVLDNIAELTNG